MKRSAQLTLTTKQQVWKRRILRLVAAAGNRSKAGMGSIVNAPIRAIWIAGAVAAVFTLAAASNVETIQAASLRFHLTIVTLRATATEPPCVSMRFFTRHGPNHNVGMSAYPPLTGYMPNCYSQLSF